MIRYVTRAPTLVRTTNTCSTVDPAFPNDSLITPAYVILPPEAVGAVYRSRNSTETSQRNATKRMSAMAGKTPSTFNVAGIDMIPAPTMLVDRLNTAPETDASGGGVGMVVLGMSGEWRLPPPAWVAGVGGFISPEEE